MKGGIYIKELINREDKNGIRLKEGDIIAESNIGKTIWNGQGIVVSRPLGKVVVYDNALARIEGQPEESDCYNIIQIRKGSVKLTNQADDWMLDRLGDSNGYSELNVSTYDGIFTAWDNIEKIGSVYDLIE